MSENLSLEVSQEDQVASPNYIEDEKIIYLLEEKLSVHNKKQKIGEVIVRKEIETKMIQIPVRREKLIIEQISPEHKQLAEIDLNPEDFSSVLTTPETLAVNNSDGGFIVTGEFSSLKILSLLLNGMDLEKNHGCQQIKISILVENESQQQKYQEWFNRCQPN